MKQFQKKQEDFVCEQCGAHVTGDGYTDHCPSCLYGKHVDVFPGDRAEECHGLLKPISVGMHKGQETIFYTCQVCGLKRVNKVSKNDSREALIALAKRFADTENH